MTEPSAVIPSFLIHPDAQALCAETDPDAFFPEKGGPMTAAKAVCARCELRGPCYDYALANDVEGIWAGTSALERRKLRAGQPPRIREHRNWVDTATQERVLDMLRLGWSAIEIGAEMGISSRTVHRIRARLEGEAA